MRHSAAQMASLKTEAIHVAIIAVVVIAALTVACKLLRRGAGREAQPAKGGGGAAGALVFVAICVGVWAILSHGAKQAGHALRAVKPRPVPAPARTVIVQRAAAPAHAAAHFVLTGTEIVLIVVAACLALVAAVAITRGSGEEG